MASDGNPAGIARNLEGARSRLAEAAARTADRRRRRTARGSTSVALIAAIDLRLADLAAHPAGATLEPPDLRRSAQ